MSSRARIVVVIGLVLLAGCAGFGGNSADAASGGSGDGGDGAQMDAGASDAGGPEPADAGASAESSDQVNADAVRDQRAIIRSGRMVIEVENFSDSNDAIAARARERGGYVSDSSRELHRDGDEVWYTGYIVVRIPSEEYEPMQETVSDQGTVRSEETSTEDVTDQLVDLEARLDNLRGRRDRLRTFYEEANSTEELLRIEKELSSVQNEIERLEAQKRSLEQRVAYSTLRVEIHEPAPGPTEVREQYHEQSLVAVFLSSVHDIYVFGRATLVTIVGIAPWVAVLAIPVVSGHRLLRGRWIPFRGRRGKQSGTDSTDSSGSQPPTAADEDTEQAETAQDDDANPPSETQDEEGET